MCSLFGSAEAILNWLTFAGLIGLGLYVYYTRRIAIQALRQVEAIAQPAMVAEFWEHDQNSVVIRNIGTDMALNVRWEVKGTDTKGQIQYIKAVSYRTKEAASVRPLWATTLLQSCASTKAYQA
jgi:hypothetical protein